MLFAGVGFCGPSVEVWNHYGAEDARYPQGDNSNGAEVLTQRGRLVFSTFKTGPCCGRTPAGKFYILRGVTFSSLVFCLGLGFCCECFT